MSPEGISGCLQFVAHSYNPPSSEGEVRLKLFKVKDLSSFASEQAVICGNWSEVLFFLSCLISLKGPWGLVIIFSCFEMFGGCLKVNLESKNL